MTDPRKIVTEFVNPPIPPRQFDWAAYFDGDEPNELGHMRHGSGATEYAAIKDLIESQDEPHILHEHAIRVFGLFQIISPGSFYLSGAINTVTSLLGVTFEKGVIAGIDRLADAIKSKPEDELATGPDGAGTASASCGDGCKPAPVQISEVRP